MIHYRNIHKSFDLPVLAGIELRVGTGEMFALFGPSGTGKSVLLKTTIGLITPDRGDVEIDGLSVFYGGKGAMQAARQSVGFVFQNAALFDSLNVFDNVGMGIPEAELSALPRAEVVRRVGRSLELVNLDPTETMDKIPSELSGGMKKRVGIARAIVGRPKILLWDEPTTGLDPINTAAVERLIKRLSTELEVTSFLVTHDIEGGLDMCDRVAMLDGGRLRFCGTPEEFRASPDHVVQAFVDRAAAEAALDRVVESDD
ncbi:MAG: ATP-binding cassette domain-containing protein [Longimicrobiales bacterium]|nr:ATP-binding cassette domain-containing protein [Longimicrobiales bacterium]